MKQSERLKILSTFAVQNITRQIFGANFWLFYLLIIVLSFLQNGIWYSPQTERILLISKDIFSNPFLDHNTNQWLLSSFLGPVLGYLTSMNQSLLSYSLMHLAIFVVVFTILILVIKHQHGDFIARSVLIIFFLSPIASVLFTWLGSPDIITILLSMAIVVFWNSSIVWFISAFFMGINHPEQGLIILLLLSIFASLTRKKQATVKFLVIGLSSLFFGKSLLGWYFDSHNFAIEFTRVDFISRAGLFQYVKATFSNPFALFFSLFNVLAIFIAVYILYFWEKERIPLAFIIYCLLAFIPTLLTLDQTRVFSVLTFPALLLLPLSSSFINMEFTEKLFFQNILAVSFVIGIFVPRFVVWEGYIYSSAYHNIIDSWIQLVSATG